MEKYWFSPARDAQGRQGIPRMSPGVLNIGPGRCYMHHVMGQRIVAAKIKRLNHFLVGHPVKTARMAPKKRKVSTRAAEDNTEEGKERKKAKPLKATKAQQAKKPKAPYYLFKSEPSAYSINALESEKDSTAEWDGVRNYQARNIMQEMQVGDRAFYYHSNCKLPGIVGVVEVVKEAYPDHTAWDPNTDYYDPKSSADAPRWYMVDIKLIRRTKRTISLPELKGFKNKELSKLVLVNNSRLSVQPVGEEEWEFILGLEDQEGPDEANKD